MSLEMAGKMGLVDEAGLESDPRQRSITAEQCTSPPHADLLEIAMRRQPDRGPEDPVEMERTQSRDRRQFGERQVSRIVRVDVFANQPRCRVVIARPVICAGPAGMSSNGRRQYREQPRFPGDKQRAGFRSAVTTRERPIFVADRARPHEIPRIGVSGTMAHLDYLAQRLRMLRDASAAEF